MVCNACQLVTNRFGNREWGVCRGVGVSRGGPRGVPGGPPNGPPTRHTHHSLTLAIVITLISCHDATYKTARNSRRRWTHTQRVSSWKIFLQRHHSMWSITLMRDVEQKVFHKNIFSWKFFRHQHKLSPQLHLNATLYTHLEKIFSSWHMSTSRKKCLWSEILKNFFKSWCNSRHISKKISSKRFFFFSKLFFRCKWSNFLKFYFEK
jgi:hypothetical protein